MNRIAHVDRRVSCENALISAFACVYVYQLCVLRQRTGLSPGWQNVRQKLRAQTEKVSVPLVQTVSLVEFFSSAFSNLLVDWCSSCSASGMCHRVVYMYMYTHVAQKKKPQKDMWLVENDTWTRSGHESKIQTKRMMHAGAAKKNVETDSESSKNIDPGEMLQAGLRDVRRPRMRCPLSLGDGSAPAAEGEYI